MVNRGLLRSRRRALGPRRRAFQTSLLGLLHYHVCPSLVGWVVKQTTDIMHKQWVQEIGDLLLVGKFQSTLKWDPEEERN